MRTLSLSTPHITFMLLCLFIGGISIKYPRLTWDYFNTNYMEMRQFMYLADNKLLPYIFPYSLTGVSLEFVMPFGLMVIMIGILAMIQHEATLKAARYLGCIMLILVAMLTFPYPNVSKFIEKCRMLSMIIGLLSMLLILTKVPSTEIVYEQMKEAEAKS